MRLRRCGVLDIGWRKMKGEQVETKFFLKNLVSGWLGERFLWRVHPLWGIVEAVLVGSVVLFLLSRMQGEVSPFVFSNGVLALCGVSGMWAVLRIRMPDGAVWRQAVWEIGVGFLLSLVMAVGLRSVGRLSGWESAWLRSGWGLPEITLYLLGIGIGYLPARAGVRLLRYWNAIRQQKMRWQLTHALVIVSVVVALVTALLPMVFAPSGEPLPFGPDLYTAVITRFLHTILPFFGLFLMVSVAVMIILLPLFMLFSLLVARRTTRRLEQLTAVTNALQSGDYSIRVPVSGADEVAQLQHNFNTMADQLQTTLADLETERDRVEVLLRAQRDLIANVSHELRTPVATIRAMLETSRSDDDSDVPVMSGEIKRLQRLIDDLFTLSRLEAGGLSLECQPTDIVPIVERQVAAQAPLAWKSRRVEVVAELPASLPVIVVDETRLEQIVSNLLRNGVAHTQPGGIVAVMAELESSSLLLHVRDTGAGIAADDLLHIWERFYQGGNGRSASGAGLGLALVKELTEAMNGRVEVISVVGEGSCFTLTFPLDPAGG
ncbi:MAG: sensor histidine kinase [Chloroflexi bacterium]|nr:MAG: sensor histidine kinase [Chloroflexota bacterium]